MNGDLPPEVWAERDIAATLNLNDLGSESRAVELVTVFSHTAGIDVQPSSSVPPTMKAGHDTMPSIQSGTTVRRLTPRECERLQGLPDDWTLTSNGIEQADSPRYRQLGNSVAVPVFDWLFARLVEVDS